MSVPSQKNIEDFLASYKAALLWSSTDEHGEPLDDNYDNSSFDEDSAESILTDCSLFCVLMAAEIETWDDKGEAYSQAGHDFALTRNGHGAGFWDGDWNEPAGELLTKAAKAAGESNAMPYQNKDGDWRICVFPLVMKLGS